MSDFEERFKWEGGRVPSVKPEHLAATWKFMGEAQEGVSNTKTYGLGIVLARGELSADEIEFLSRAEGGGPAFVMRSLFLQSLVQREVLHDYTEGSELDQRVFGAVASFPLNEEDFAEAALQLQLKKLSPEKSSQLRAGLIAEGYNPAEPKVDARFLEWIRRANT